MTIQESQELLERLKIKATSTSEIKNYENFIQVLTKLNERTFSKEDTQLIETKLDHLELNSILENKKNTIKKALNEFEKYLKDTFSLTSKGYYTKLYGGLGLSFGIMFGTAILSNLERSLGVSLGLIGGMLIGITIGRIKDQEAKAAENVL